MSSKHSHESSEESDEIRGVTRRQFLEILSASFAAMTMAGCKLRPPQEKIRPYLVQPEEMAPGQTKWYASTCGGCSAACGALIKIRDGRPIKLEGNPDHPLTRGGLCARGQATILDLYDSERLRHPHIDGAESNWSRADAVILSELESVRKSRRGIRLVSHTLISPSLRQAVYRFQQAHPGAKLVSYDSSSSSAIVEAHQLTHGRAALPHYRFGQAKVIVSFDADFLGTWISPVEFTKDWSANRRPDQSNELGGMSWHAQFESRMSLTGANADLRVPIRPSEEFAVLAALAHEVARKVGWKFSLPALGEASAIDKNILSKTTEMLVSGGKRSLVVSGSREVAVQVLVNALNAMLGAYGSTVDLDRPSLQKQGDDAAMARLIQEMERGEIGALLVLDANPAQDHSQAAAFAKAMSKVKLTASLSDRMDETAKLSRIAGPASHALEGWGDAESVEGVFSLFQPVLSPLFDSRPVLESVLAWAQEPASAYDFIRAYWRREIFPRQKQAKDFTVFWDDSVRSGVAASLGHSVRSKARFAGAPIPKRAAVRRPSGPKEFEIAAFSGIALAEGRQANNPWLQEMADPVTKTTWGNVASFSPEDAKRINLEEGRVVRLSADGFHAELPAHIQVGQASGVVAAALGYGRQDAGRIAANYPMVKLLPIEKDLLAGADLFPLSSRKVVSVEILDRTSPLAKTQIFDSLTDPIMGQRRPFIQDMTLEEYSNQPRGGESEESESKGLWPRHEYKGHKWGMAIDLSACSGCSACVVACQAENNIPIVGKAEVRKSREMAWLRIDRYFSEPKAGQSSSGPDVAFQPMLCQHCDDAPCETVCPVVATAHSTEGLNMQVYNRCVGTRYCENNCPYKVRRFNWFDYTHQDLMQNLSLNPDVTVRSRGVMEKCTFCVQRISSAKADAKQENRDLKEGDVKTACQQSCPADAIIFGDLNDPNSKIGKIAKEPRSYRVLAELGVGPSIFYQTKVRNKKV